MKTKLPAISHARGRGQMNHNNREHKSFGDNVDKARIKDNVTYIREDLLTAYEKCYGQAQREFDSQQKRDDRKIQDYYTHLFGEAPKSSIATAPKGQQSYYEIVVGIGDMNTAPVGSKQGEQMSKILDQYVQDFQARNPNFYVFNAVKHMDEKTPHVHLNYIPVAKGYKRGMAVQNGHAKALEQMGYGNNKQSIDNWRKSERAIIRDLCQQQGIKLEPEKKGRGKTYTPDMYKKAMDDAKAEARQDPAVIDEIKSELKADFITSNKQSLITEAKDLATKELNEILKPIKEKMNVALAEKANLAVFKDIEIKKSLTGGIVLGLKTKGKVLTLEHVEALVELAKNQRSHERRCNQKVTTAQEELVKAQDEAKRAKTEATTQKGIAKEAMQAWTETIAVYKGSTVNGKPRVSEPSDVPKASQYYKDGFIKQQKIAKRVPELEEKVATLSKNQATAKQQEFAELPDTVQDSLLWQGKQQVEQARQVQRDATAQEKARLRSLHKTKSWMELTKDEKREVKRLLVNSREFENRQDFLDFKKEFGKFAERERG